MTMYKKLEEKAKKLRPVAIGIIVFIVLVGIFSGGGDKEPSKRDLFYIAAQERVDNTAASFSEDELDRIECVEGKCDTMIFHFKKLPEDHEFLIRSNAGVMSVFKLKETGTSHVTVYSYLNGSQVFMCNASKGKVDECK